MGFREEIFKLDSTRMEPVEVDGWPDGLFVKELSGSEGDKLADAKSMVSALIVCLCLVDKDGVRVFTDADIAKVNQRPARELKAVADAAYSINGIGGESAKNLEATQENSSGTS